MTGGLIGLSRPFVSSVLSELRMIILTRLGHLFKRTTGNTTLFRCRGFDECLCSVVKRLNRAYDVIPLTPYFILCLRRGSVTVFGGVAFHFTRPLAQNFYFSRNDCSVTPREYLRNSLGGLKLIHSLFDNAHCAFMCERCWRRRKT